MRELGTVSVMLDKYPAIQSDILHILQSKKQMSRLEQAIYPLRRETDSTVVDVAACERDVYLSGVETKSFHSLSHSTDESSSSAPLFIHKRSHT